MLAVLQIFRTGTELEGEVIEGEGEEPESELVPEPEHSAEAEDVPPPTEPMSRIGSLGFFV